MPFILFFISFIIISYDVDVKIFYHSLINRIVLFNSKSEEKLRKKQISTVTGPYRKTDPMKYFMSIFQMTP